MCVFWLWPSQVKKNFIAPKNYTHNKSLVIILNVMCSNYNRETTHPPRCDCGVVSLKKTLNTLSSLPPKFKKCYVTRWNCEINRYIRARGVEFLSPCTRWGCRYTGLKTDYFTSFYYYYYYYYFPKVSIIKLIFVFWKERERSKRWTVVKRVSRGSDLRTTFQGQFYPPESS